MLRFLLAFIIAIALLSPAAAAELADGRYRCVISSYHLGDIEIDGSVYRGPAFDGKFEGDYPFELTEGGTINWGGPLGGISLAGKVVSTVITDAGNDRAGFDITLQNTDSGNFQTVSCFPE